MARIRGPRGPCSPTGCGSCGSEGDALKRRFDQMRKIVFLVLCLICVGCSNVAEDQIARNSRHHSQEQQVNQQSISKDPRQTIRPVSDSKGKDCFFTGYAEFHPRDTDGDGIFNQLSVSVEVQMVKGGSYTIFGELKKGNDTISIVPFWHSQIFSSTSFEGDPGVYMIQIDFSGEDIFTSKRDGPYEVSLDMIGERGWADSFVFQTPAYEHQKFGEQGSYILSVEDEAMDTDSNGKYNFIKFIVSVLVRKPGQYDVECFVEGGLDKEIFSSLEAFDFNATGIHPVEIFLPGHKISRSKRNGPYEGLINLSFEGSSLESRSFTSRPYKFLDFEPVLMNIKGHFQDMGIDENGDGKYDLLRITFDVESSVSGEYRVEVHLTSPIHMSAGSSVVLQKGLQPLSFDFYGPDIQRTGQGGPYVLSVVLLLDNDSWAILDEAQVTYLTRPYDVSDFNDRHPSFVELEERLKRSNDLSTPVIPLVTMQGKFSYVSPFYKGIFRADHGKEYLVFFRYPEKPGEERFSDFLNKYAGQRVRLMARQDTKDIRGSIFRTLKMKMEK